MAQEQRDRWVAEAAYYLAERRGFSGGDMLADWLEAERRWEHEVSPFPDAVPNEGAASRQVELVGGDVQSTGEGRDEDGAPSEGVSRPT